MQAYKATQLEKYFFMFQANGYDSKVRFTPKKNN